MKTISVIIPTFNREAYIEAALQSVVSQKLPAGYQLEVIVADDGSTDKTAAVVAKFGSKVKYLPLPHAGKPATPRNAAIKAASGELIAFQDSDDLWAEDKLLNQLPAFDDKKVMMSFGNAEIMDQDGSRTGKQYLTPTDLKDGEKFETLLKHNVISTLTVMVRKQALDTVGLFNEADELRAVEDYELWLRITAKYPGSARSIDKTLAYYRAHGGNISSADDLMAINRILNVYDAVWRTNWLNDSQRDQLEQELATMHTNWSRLSNEIHPDKRPTVSVVMGVYNSAQYLRPAIASILNQTYQNFEFIIVNDGSTDTSAEIINSFNDPRIRLVSQRNHGLVYSLNKGISVARGKYIARQDADDISLPSRFEKELQLFTSNPKLGVVGTFFTYIDEVTEEPSITITSPTLNIDVKRLLYFTNPFGHGTTMFTTTAFKNAGPYSGDYGPTEDMDLWRRMAEVCDFGIVPESLYWYRLNPSSISHTKGELQHKFTAQFIDEQWAKPLYLKSSQDIIEDGRYYQQYKSTFTESIYNQYVAYQIDLAKALLHRGMLRSGIRNAYGAWRLKPASWKYLLRTMLAAPLYFLNSRKRK